MSFRGRTVPMHIRIEARRAGLPPSLSPLVFGGGDFHWEDMLSRADKLEKQAKALRVCAAWMRDTPLPAREEVSGDA